MSPMPSLVSSVGSSIINSMTFFSLLFSLLPLLVLPFLVFLVFSLASPGSDGPAFFFRLIILVSACFASSFLTFQLLPAN